MLLPYLRQVHIIRLQYQHVMKESFQTDQLRFSVVSATRIILAALFEKASRQPWFNNTLFVITADHTSFGTYPEYMTDLGLYSVPILFYAPGMPELRGMEDKIVEQIYYADCTGIAGL